MIPLDRIMSLRPDSTPEQIAAVAHDVNRHCDRHLPEKTFRKIAREIEPVVALHLSMEEGRVTQEDTIRASQANPDYATFVQLGIPYVKAVILLNQKMVESVAARNGVEGSIAWKQSTDGSYTVGDIKPEQVLRRMNGDALDAKLVDNCLDRISALTEVRERFDRADSLKPLEHVQALFSLSTANHHINATDHDARLYSEGKHAKGATKNPVDPEIFAEQQWKRYSGTNASRPGLGEKAARFVDSLAGGVQRLVRSSTK